ncbi:MULTISPECIES: hypothetical protein [Arthrobacter]|uniref:Uncharacterized protein n=2 Tax=Arthrobacter TaxID=1663 RepID=A0ABU9KK97_9MICC|nr:hypothetical protein [Arthrobacter sp. YJM1]MDP5226645.1 hypothetical protein [Arthrobacter sp. YJM1]
MRLLTTRIMLGAIVACGLLLVQDALAMETLGLVLLLFSAAVAVVCSVASVAILRRNKTLLAAGILTTLAVIFILAFIRVWGLGSGEGYDVGHSRGLGAGSDVFLFLGLGFGGPAVLTLFLGSVWPVKDANPRRGARGKHGTRSTGSSVRRGAPRKPSASRPARPARPRASQSSVR